MQDGTELVFGANISQTRAIDELQKPSQPEAFHRMADHLLRIAGRLLYCDTCMLVCLFFCLYHLALAPAPNPLVLALLQLPPFLPMPAPPPDPPLACAVASAYHQKEANPSSCPWRLPCSNPKRHFASGGLLVNSKCASNCPICVLQRYTNINTNALLDFYLIDAKFS